MSALQKRSKESEPAHRGLLLYAMQQTKRRSMRAVSRAMERSSTTVREYSIRWEWAERMEASGANCEVEAQQLYRHLYFPALGVKEISMVQRNIAAAISVTGPTPRSVTDAVEKAIQTSEEKKPTVFDQEIKRKHLMLVDAAIAYVAQGIKNGEIRTSLRDIPHLMQLRREMIGESVDKTNTAQLVSESIRVRDAKAKGKNVLQAMHEDAIELATILSALKSKGEAPTQAATAYTGQVNDV